jgi:hypothetical protein
MLVACVGNPALGGGRLIKFAQSVRPHVYTHKSTGKPLKGFSLNLEEEELCDKLKENFNFICVERVYMKTYMCFFTYFTKG